jgi:biopolymer transport protein ExbD
MLSWNKYKQCITEAVQNVRYSVEVDYGTSQKDALTVEMDQTLSFKLLKRVMLTAQQAEFVAFKLLVNKANDG